jgi:hypothetical protein
MGYALQKSPSTKKKFHLGHERLDLCCGRPKKKKARNVCSVLARSITRASESQIYGESTSALAQAAYSLRRTRLQTAPSLKSEEKIKNLVVLLPCSDWGRRRTAWPSGRGFSGRLSIQSRALIPTGEGHQKNSLHNPLHLLERRVARPFESAQYRLPMDTPV